MAAAVRAAGVPAVVVNRTHELAPWADLLVGNDSVWWTLSENEAALRFAGIKVCCGERAARAVMSLRNTGPDGFDPDPACVRTGGNGGYTALHIATHARAARALLCGFDMRGAHWHAPHRLKNPTAKTFERWIIRFEAVAAKLAARGLEVLNCTPGSALKCFPFVPLDEALAACAVPAARHAALPEAVLP